MVLRKAVFFINFGMDSIPVYDGDLANYQLTHRRQMSYSNKQNDEMISITSESDVRISSLL